MMGLTFPPLPIHAGETLSPMVAAGHGTDASLPGHLQACGSRTLGLGEGDFRGAATQERAYASSDLRVVSPRAVVGMKE